MIPPMTHEVGMLETGVLAENIQFTSYDVLVEHLQAAPPEWTTYNIPQYYLHRQGRTDNCEWTIIC